MSLQGVREPLAKQTEVELTTRITSTKCIHFEISVVTTSLLIYLYYRLFLLLQIDP